MGDYMGKKANGKLNRKIPYEEQSSKKPRRWDHIFGILTVATIIWFGLIIYNDFKSLGTDTNINNTQDETLDSAIAAKDDDLTMMEKNTWVINNGNVICIDAGHGGGDKGTVSGNYKESAICLLIAKSVQQELEHMGAQVVMTRTDDIAISQEQRVKIGNDKKADIFVSIHLNSSANETANGAEAWIHSSKPNNSLKLSKTILEEIAINTGIHNRDVKYGTLADSKENYYINSRSKSASLILELGFITSSSDMLVINNKTEHIAKAIASGIAKYLNGGDKGESGKY